ncbi:MAG: thiamine phosphate synthase [Tannerellaceae bacterium]|jgi:thiamine-phosphate pyrophosphorylase|nr:thiamine phosphate synthase [Tannerellaceae bacterium]
MPHLEIAVITWPEFLVGEAKAVEALFAAGLQRLHLRKPCADAEALRGFMEDIDKRFHRRITVHGSPKLFGSLDVGGFHVPKGDIGEVGRGMRRSCSCHSLEEVAAFAPLCDYVFLSPIFDSLSKQGYKAAFSEETLTEGRQRGIISQRVYALGGIMPERIGQVKSMGFGGVGVLGYIWEPPVTEAVERYSRLLL